MAAVRLSRRLARAMAVLTTWDDFDLDTQWRMYEEFRTTDADELSDYPDWVVDLIAKAERPAPPML